MRTDGENVTHPSAELITAQIEHRLVGVEREAMLTHLESCAECRHEIAEAARLIADEEVARRRIGVPIIALLAAAAAFVMVARGAWQPGRLPTDERTERLAQPDLVPPIVTLRPSDDEVVTGPKVLLLWHAYGAGAMYQVTLQDDTGKVLWTSSTRDTTTSVPSELRLPEGNSYFWSVDALRPDGRTTTSKAHRFRR